MTRRLLILIAVAVLYGAAQWSGSLEDIGLGRPGGPATADSSDHGAGSSPGAAESTPTGYATDDSSVIAQAFRDGRSDIVVEIGGEVERVLPDDRDGSQHQRFVLRLENDHTVLVAHNIDLAERVPLDRGDHVDVRGEFEWNDKGGVIHWTHHDPQGRRPGGWVQHEGKLYK